MPAEIRKRLGEFFILFIYLAIDGYGLWPISHFWSLTVGVAGFVALLFLDGGFSEYKISLYTAILLVGCVVFYFVAPPIPPPEPWRGWLQPANDPTPANGCDSAPVIPGFSIPPDAPVMVAGGVGVRLTIPGRTRLL